MKIRRLSCIGRFLTVLCLTFMPCAIAMAASAIAPTTETTQHKQPEDRTEYLLVQHGVKAIIESKAGNKTFTITLLDVSPHVDYFSDRPNRKAGSLPLQEFLKLWESKGVKSFHNNPPNAYFNAMEEGTATSGNIKNLSIELSNPQYDSKTNTLRYTATPLPGTNMLNTSGTFKYITLFIDDVCLACW